MHVFENINQKLLGGVFDNIAEKGVKSPKYVYLFDDSFFFELNRELGLVVEVYLATGGVHDEYVGYKVDVIHKVNGKVNSHHFMFDSYFGKHPEPNWYWTLHKSQMYGNAANWKVMPEKKDLEAYRTAIINYLLMFK